MQIKSIILVLGIAAGSTPGILGYEKIYSSTAPGKIELKDLPARTAMEASSDGDYFRNDNGLFRTLFRHIKKEDLKMTVPVEADPNPANMRFYAGGDARGKDLKSDTKVQIKKLPARRVLSVGLRGSYSKKNYEYTLQRAERWLLDHPEWKAAGAPYMVYWNGPFVPGLLKRSELHLAVVKREVKKQEKALLSPAK